MSRPLVLFLIFLLAGVDFTAVQESAPSADPNTLSRDVSDGEAWCAQSAPLATLGGRWARACDLVKHDGVALTWRPRQAREAWP